ncbi:MAG: energy-coupling factor ABC transporter permease [Pontibacterium sp.]
MSISEGLLSSAWFWPALLIYLLVLGASIYLAPWRALFNNRRLQHLFLGATVCVALMWSMRAGISPGLGIHFLGMTVLVLVFGLDLGIVAGSLGLLAMTILGRESWEGFPVNGLCSVVLPALASYILLKWVEAKLGRNFFVYLFLCAFFGAGVAAAVSGLSTALVLWFDGVYSWAKITHEYVQYLPLIMFPEGLMNGIIMTGMMVFHPDWVRTFDAKLYIDDQ